MTTVDSLPENMLLNRSKIPVNLRQYINTRRIARYACFFLERVENVTNRQTDKHS